MEELTRTLSDRIAATTEPFSSADDSLLLAHEIIAKVRIIGFTPCDDRIETGDFGAEHVGALRGALLAYSRAHFDHPTRASAYWGIAALHDQNELELLRGLLELESTRECVDEDVLWQLMIALDNIGEDVLSPIHADPIEQAGDRWAAARLYLHRSR